MGTESNLFEVNPARLVNGSHFPQGVLEFPFSIGAPNCWNPAKSYFRIGMTVYGAPVAGPAVTAPAPYEMVAFADNAVGNMFDNCYLRSNNVSISSIVQGYSQASALKSRLGKGYSYLKSLGMGTNMNEARFPRRVMNSAVFNPPDSKLNDMNEMFKPVAAGFFGTAQVGIVANASQVTGANTDFTTGMPTQNGAPTGGSVDPGDVIVILGIPYEIVEVKDNLTLTISSPIGGNPVPQTTNWYIERRDLVRGPQAQNTIYALFQPPMGIFDHDGLIGSGDFRFTLNPNTNYLLTGVETRNPTARASVDGLSGSYSLVVNECKFYAHVEKMRIPDSVQDLALNEFLVQSKPYLANLQFSVPPSTQALTIFVQDPRANSSPLIPPSMFKMLDNSDLALQSIQVTYGGITKPSTAWQSFFTVDDVSGGDNQFQQRYNDTYEESGIDVRSAGVESYYDYLLRGPIYHFSFSRDAASRATEVQVNTQFNGLANGPGGGTGLVYCVAWYRRVVQITTAAGLLTNVVARQV